MPNSPADIKAEILRLTREFSRQFHTANRPGYSSADGPPAPFVPGQTIVPYAGRVFTGDEVAAAVSATLDFWLTLGREGEAFEQKFAAFLGVKTSVLCNSGSSANLLAVSALSSPRLGNRQLKPGDEIITSAAGFPTTVTPILQNGFVPVFIDNDPVTLNGRVDQLDEAYVEGKTKAVFMAPRWAILSTLPPSPSSAVGTIFGSSRTIAMRSVASTTAGSPALSAICPRSLFTRRII